MPDHPFAGGADTTVGPAPGYYADPSIPGFVRYWGGSAWVPGTSRPTPAEGEVLEPPRFLSRQAGPAAPRYVPPPAGAASGGSAGPGASAGSTAGETGTGPVFFDQTSAGTSFTMAPQAELELRRRAEVEARAQLHAQLPVQAQWGGPPFSAPLPAHGADPAPRTAASAGGRGVAPGSALQQYADLLADPAPAVPVAVPVPAPVPAPVALRPATGPQADASGWQADPRAQRGLMETGGSPRWVSWGVLPGPVEAEADPAEVPEAVAEPVEESVEEPVDGPGAELTTGPVEEPAEEPVEASAEPVAARPTPTPVTAPTPTAPAPTLVRARAAVAAAPARSAAPAPAGRAAAGRKVPPRPVAGLGRRLAARVVDTAVMAVVAAAAALPLASSATAHIEEKLDRAAMASNLAGRQTQVWLVDGVVLGKAAALLGILLLAGFLYEVLPTARTGQTFGKRLLGIRVVDARPTSGPAPRKGGAGRARPAERPGPAKPPALGRSFVRWIVRQLATVLVIGLCWPLLDRPARRGWQDRAARTRVVKA